MPTTGLSTQASSTQRHGLRGKVLVYVGDNAHGAVLSGHADGLVLHGSAGFAAARADGAGDLRLVDRELYAPDKADPEEEMFPESQDESVQTQLDLGVGALLAPSRFPRDRGPSSIAALLDAGRDFVEAAGRLAPHLPVFVPVVMRFDELADDRWADPIRRSQLPIATVFAGHRDPLETPDQLQGAINAVAAAEAVLVMRCDISVAGFMALGALAGAVGASSAVRHLWLPSRRVRATPPGPSVFVPALANWTRARFVREAEADPDLDELFRCTCGVCGPAGDVRALAEPGGGADLQDRHSAAAAVDLVRGVVSAESPLAAWRATCERALDAYERLAGLGISGPKRPGALSAWLELLG